MKLVSTRNSPEKYFPSKTSSWLRGLESIQVKSAKANGVSRSTGGVAGGAAAAGACGIGGAAAWGEGAGAGAGPGAGGSGAGGVRSASVVGKGRRAGRSTGESAETGAGGVLASGLVREAPAALFTRSG